MGGCNHQPKLNQNRLKGWGWECVWVRLMRKGKDERAMNVVGVRNCVLSCVGVVVTSGLPPHAVKPDDASSGTVNALRLRDDVG